MSFNTSILLVKWKRLFDFGFTSISRIFLVKNKWLFTYILYVCFGNQGRRKTSVTPTFLCEA